MVEERTLQKLLKHILAYFSHFSVLEKCLNIMLYVLNTFNFICQLRSKLGSIFLADFKNIMKCYYETCCV